MLHNFRMHLIIGIKMVWFVLVDFFNGILTFMAYVMPKQSCQKNNSCIIQSSAKGIEGYIPFPRVLVQK